MAECALLDGRLDLISINRGLIADPAWPAKVRSGREEQIRRCVGCTCCINEKERRKGIVCTVNPFVGRERELAIRRADAEKRILVVGGGPAGLQAAVVAARQGHRVSLVEQERQLGGMVRAAGVPPMKWDILSLIPALAAEATIDLDYVTIVGEGFAADTFCGVDALYNETGATLFCNELIERFYSAVYGVTVFTNSGDITAASPSGYWFEVTYTPQPGDIAYASAEARERYGNHYAIVKSVDEAGSTVTLFEQNWVWDGKAGVNRRIPYDGGCYTFYTMCSSAGRAAPAGEAEPVAAAPAAEEPQPVSDDVSTIYAWGSGISSITGTPSSWAAELVSHADVYGITMLAGGSYQSAITRMTLARLAANTARTLGLVEDVSDPVAVVQQLGVMQPNADGSFDTTSRVTRQMAATVLLRLLRQSSVVFEADMSMLDRYPDSASISDWAREAVAMMTQYDLMNGTTKGFAPKKDMTLEQCLVLLTRICEF